MRIIQPTTPPLLEQDVHFPGQDEDTEPGSPISQFLHLSEHTPLLIGGPEAARPALEQSYASIRDGDEAEDSSKPSHLSNVNNTGPEAGQWGVWDLIADWQGFWIFGILVALVIGPGEMTIASIGSILTSLLPTPSSLPTPFSLFTPDNISYASTANNTDIDTDTNPLAQRNTQVFLISLSSTLARLFTGFLADYLSPPPTAVPNPAYRPDQDDPFASTPSPHDDDDHHAIAAGDGDDRERAHPEPPHLWKQIHKVRMSRAAMTGTCALLLGGVYVFAAAGLQGGKGEKRLWVLSVGVGGMYGALFTLTVCPRVVFFFFFFLSSVELTILKACDRIASFRADKLWFSMGNDFVFRGTRVCRLFRTFFRVPFFYYLELTDILSVHLLNRSTSTPSFPSLQILRQNAMVHIVLE